MATEESYRLTLRGPGLSLDRSVSAGIANRVVALTLSPEGRASEIRLIPQGEAELSGEGDTGVQTPKQFMTVKNPMTGMERVTCLAYYITHYRRRLKFKTRDLTDLNREAAQPVLSNASFAARNAANRGYLAPAGGGFKLISTIGEALVRALPDRDNIQKVLKTIAPRRRKRRKAAQEGK
ncbi:MAG: hypothetical protein HYY17_15625 [Planctomycetes bacterium]|nr:hypothetical protein [Planctomycetota bacterium]